MRPKTINPQPRDLLRIRNFLGMGENRQRLWYYVSLCLVFSGTITAVLGTFAFSTGVSIVQRFPGISMAVLFVIGFFVTFAIALRELTRSFLIAWREDASRALFGMRDPQEALSRSVVQILVNQNFPDPVPVLRELLDYGDQDIQALMAHSVLRVDGFFHPDLLRVPGIPLAVFFDNTNPGEYLLADFPDGTTRPDGQQVILYGIRQRMSEEPDEAPTPQVPDLKQILEQLPRSCIDYEHMLLGEYPLEQRLRIPPDARPFVPQSLQTALERVNLPQLAQMYNQLRKPDARPGASGLPRSESQIETMLHEHLRKQHAEYQTIEHSWQTITRALRQFPGPELAQWLEHCGYRHAREARDQFISISVRILRLLDLAQIPEDQPDSAVPGDLVPIQLLRNHLSPDPQPVVLLSINSANLLSQHISSRRLISGESYLFLVATPNVHKAADDPTYSHEAIREKFEELGFENSTVRFVTPER